MLPSTILTSDGYSIKKYHFDVVKLVEIPIISTTALSLQWIYAHLFFTSCTLTKYVSLLIGAMIVPVISLIFWT